uniref:Uncharacterized protein n=1 Tax=Avena sativa TaxID=4498 RepID=A0ACD6A2Z3_AVESA
MKKDTVVGQLLLLLIASSAARSVVSSTPGNETDRLSLLEFKKAILLDPQQALVSWNESTHLCDWEGVTCRAKDPRRVVSFHLANRGLVGKISPWLGNLTFLRNLALPTNGLTGQIPWSLGSLRRLQTLYLSNNTLQGSIPSLTNCSNLKVVWLNNNGLTGQVPADFPPNIQELQLSANSIGGTIPSSLANITTLKKISFASNRIHGNIPDELAKLDRLEILGEELQEENVVAIKVFCLETRGAQKSFIAECSALRNVRHRNLVRILTACSSIDSSGNDFKALVYEFMPKGDLHNLLYSTEDNGNSSKLSYISLAQRLSLVVDISDAVAYLHHNNHGSIVHCDLKPSNVLLDNDMVAHVGDFGLARLQVYPESSSSVDPTSISSVAIRGTIGYVAPEYGGGGQVSTAADVYSFGVILLEIFIRRSPIDDMFKDGLSIAKYAQINFPDKMLQIVDPQLAQELYFAKKLQWLMKVQCIVYVLCLMLGFAARSHLQVNASAWIKWLPSCIESGTHHT